MQTFFNTEKRNEEYVSSSKRYVILIKPCKPVPENGKKRLDPVRRKSYKDDLEQYNKCIAMLESGHVNIYNNKIKTDNSNDFAAKMLFNGIKENYRIFYINPIQSEVDTKSNLYVSEFDVEKEVKTTDELLEMIIKKQDYFEIANDLFMLGTENRDKSFDIFKKIADKTGYKYELDELIHSCTSFYDVTSVINFYNTEKVHEYAKCLLEKGLINLTQENNIYADTSAIRFLRLKWTDFALELVKKVINDKEIVDKIKQNKILRSFLTGMTDDKNVVEIIKLLNIETNQVLLEVIDENKIVGIVETKEFINMDKLKSYLITQYKLPFSDVVNLAYDKPLFLDNITFRVREVKR